MNLYTLPGKTDIILERVCAVGPVVNNINLESGSLATRRPGFNVWLDGACIRAWVTVPLSMGQWREHQTGGLAESTLKDAYTKARAEAEEERKKLIEKLISHA